jgi:hypothetical protein
VHVARHIPYSSDELSLAVAVLGRESPLVVLLDRQAVAIAQLSAVVALFGLSVVGVAAGVRGALAFALGSAVVAIGLGCRVALGVRDRRECVWDVIISGRGDVPLDVVRRERARLQDRTRRETLARWYRSIGDEPDASGRVPCRACVIVVPSLVARVRPELALVAALLCDDAPSVRGVAAARRLMCAGTSLFGRDPEILRQDLRRIAHLLRG